MAEEYTVRWETDVEADSPEEAALEAMRMQRDHDSEAVVFTVVLTRRPSQKTEIDLLDLPAYWQDPAGGLKG